MSAVVGWYLAAWAVGYVLGFKLKQIRMALQAA